MACLICLNSCKDKTKTEETGVLITDSNSSNTNAVLGAANDSACAINPLVGYWLSANYQKNILANLSPYKCSKTIYDVSEIAVDKDAAKVVYGNAEAEELMKGRFAIMNVWRGNRQTVESMPLAFADARSLDPADLIPVERRSEYRIGEIQHLVHNPDQHWYYLPKVEPDEAILIKCFDSDDTKAKLTAHTAFADPATRADAPPRESIESRTFVFY